MEAPTRPTSPGASTQAGSAYLVALLALFLLAMLGLSVSLITQTEVLSSSQGRTIERTFYSAEAGIALSIANALADGDFSGVEQIAERTALEQGQVMRVRDRVRSSPMLCLGEAPCNLCSINQGSNYLRRNHALAANATRSGVAADDSEVLVGRKSLAIMVDVEPMESVLGCLAELPESLAEFEFDEY